MLALNLPLLADALSPGYSASSFFYKFQPHTSVLHDVLVFTPMILAAAVGLWRSRTAGVTERRRVSVLGASLGLGLAPLLIVLVLEPLIPPYREWVRVIENRRLLGFTFIFPALVSIPFTTAYAVLFHKVLDVRFIARKALQYALARYSALGLAAVPLALLAAFLYDHRNRTLAEIFSGGSALLLLLLATSGVVLFVRRKTLLDFVDRRFFREQYDARQILTPLVDSIRSAVGRKELSDLVCHGIDRALHVETIALLVEEPDRGELADPTERVRPRPISSPLVSLVSSSRQPLEVDLEHKPRAYPTLSERDRHWLVDGDFRLLVPIISFGGTLFGIIAVGEKKSSLPYLKEDLQLVSAIANSAALALEVQRLRTQRSEGNGPGTEPALPTAAAAQECFGCGRLYLPQNRRCTACDRDLDAALVPYVLPGRFRFERRLGAGGMGVVYRAVDLALTRSVAIKTMRRFSVDDSLRLRREARAAAAVFHPNLALIYGVESWQSTPMLIMEFLEGTLEERLEKEVLQPRETLDLGIALAGALEQLHGANILHRDLKPSNIGYGRDGSPKLMDFGIARLQFDLRRETALLTDGPTGMPGIDSETWGGMGTTTTASRQMVGTLHYLSPEAVQGENPGPGFDLWGLTIVLYECLVGERVFNGTVREVMDKILKAEIPRLRTHRPDCPQQLDDFFAAALDPDPRRRPHSAASLRGVLQGLRQKI